MPWKNMFLLVRYLTKLALGGRAVHHTNQIRLKYIRTIQKIKNKSLAMTNFILLQFFPYHFFHHNYLKKNISEENWCHEYSSFVISNELGRSRSPSPSGRRARKDMSPTPATEIKGKKTTVPELTKGKQTINVSSCLV